MAGKLDMLRESIGGNARASLGGDRQSVGPSHEISIPARVQGVSRSKDMVMIETARIEPDPAQPREEFDAEGLERLAESLKTRGQLQPIRVRWDEPASVYRIVCGERRWRAAKSGGLSAMSCVILDGSTSAADILAIQLVENALREDLKPIEQAKAYQRLIDANGWSQRQLARELAIDHSIVARSMALLDLPPAIQDRVDSGEIGAALGSAIAGIGDPKIQAEIAEEAVRRKPGEKMSRAEVAKVRRVLQEGRRPGDVPPARTVDLGTCAVTIKWRRSDGHPLEPTAALSRALAILRDEAKSGKTAV